MHVTLTDALACPDCGPDWGLILIARRTANRRLLDGHFGCANCRKQWELRNGFVDFGAMDSDDADTVSPSQDATLVIAAGMGVTEGPATVMLIGAGAVNASLLQSMIGNIEVIGVSKGLAMQEEVEGISRLAAGENLPFRNACVRAIALTDEASLKNLEQAARITRARLVALSGSDAVRQRMEASGLHIVLHDKHVTVAQRAAN
ncbi:MAG TPA: hypothetical protein VM100_00915 [Longimicrobiales bacterium]|nr:hypothetical protein [Longimicrobiales bacterium]